MSLLFPSPFKEWLVWLQKRSEEFVAFCRFPVALRGVADAVARRRDGVCLQQCAVREDDDHNRTKRRGDAQYVARADLNVGDANSIIRGVNSPVTTAPPPPKTRARRGGVQHRFTQSRGLEPEHSFSWFSLLRRGVMRWHCWVGNGLASRTAETWETLDNKQPASPTTPQ